MCLSCFSWTDRIPLYAILLSDPGVENEFFVISIYLAVFVLCRSHTGSGVKMGRSSIPIVGILLLCCLVSSSEAEYLKYKDPKQPLNVRINDLLKRMTLEEKIGQMVQIERSVATGDVMKKYFIG